MKFIRITCLAMAAILAACVTTTPVSAPGGAVATAPTSSAAAGLTRPFLWTATKDGRTHALLGTVHAGVDAERELPSAVWTAFDQADCFVMEADLAAGSSELLDLATTESPSLRQRLRPETWDKLQARLSPKLPPGLLERAEPWFATMLYLQTLTPAGEPMDAVLQAKARNAGKRLVYLETWREALVAFATVTEVADLEQLVAEGDDSQADLQRMLTAYRSGDEGQLGRVIDEINATAIEPEKKLDVLVVGRNRSWQPRLVEALSKGHCFVAVGTAHLIGADNLRTLLQDAGFVLQRLKE